MNITQNFKLKLFAILIISTVFVGTLVAYYFVSSKIKDKKTADDKPMNVESSTNGGKPDSPVKLEPSKLPNMAPGVNKEKDKEKENTLPKKDSGTASSVDPGHETDGGEESETETETEETNYYEEDKISVHEDSSLVAPEFSSGSLSGPPSPGLTGPSSSSDGLASENPSSEHPSSPPESVKKPVSQPPSQKIEETKAAPIIWNSIKLLGAKMYSNSCFYAVHEIDASDSDPENRAYFFEISNRNITDLNIETDSNGSKITSMKIPKDDISNLISSMKTTGTRSRITIEGKNYWIMVTGLGDDFFVDQNRIEDKIAEIVKSGNNIFDSFKSYILVGNIPNRSDIFKLYKDQVDIKILVTQTQEVGSLDENIKETIHENTEIFDLKTPLDVNFQKGVRVSKDGGIYTMSNIETSKQNHVVYYFEVSKRTADCKFRTNSSTEYITKMPPPTEESIKNLLAAPTSRIKFNIDGAEYTAIIKGEGLNPGHSGNSVIKSIIELYDAEKCIEFEAFKKFVNGGFILAQPFNFKSNNLNIQILLIAPEPNLKRYNDFSNFSNLFYYDDNSYIGTELVSEDKTSEGINFIGGQMVTNEMTCSLYKMTEGSTSFYYFNVSILTAGTYSYLKNKDEELKVVVNPPTKATIEETMKEGIDNVKVKVYQTPFIVHIKGCDGINKGLGFNVLKSFDPTAHSIDTVAKALAYNVNQNKENETDMLSTFVKYVEGSTFSSKPFNFSKDDLNIKITVSSPPPPKAIEWESIKFLGAEINSNSENGFYSVHEINGPNTKTAYFFEVTNTSRNTEFEIEQDGTIIGMKPPLDEILTVTEESNCSCINSVIIKNNFYDVRLFKSSKGCNAGDEEIANAVSKILNDDKDIFESFKKYVETKPFMASAPFDLSIKTLDIKILVTPSEIDTKSSTYNIEVTSDKNTDIFSLSPKEAVSPPSKSFYNFICFQAGCIDNQNIYAISRVETSKDNHVVYYLEILKRTVGCRFTTSKSSAKSITYMPPPTKDSIDELLDGPTSRITVNIDDGKKFTGIIKGQGLNPGHSVNSVLKSIIDLYNPKGIEFQEFQNFVNGEATPFNFADENENLNIQILVSVPKISDSDSSIIGFELIRSNEASENIELIGGKMITEKEFCALYKITREDNNSFYYFNVSKLPKTYTKSNKFNLEHKIQMNPPTMENIIQAKAAGKEVAEKVVNIGNDNYLVGIKGHDGINKGLAESSGYFNVLKSFDPTAHSIDTVAKALAYNLDQNKENETDMLSTFVKYVEGTILSRPFDFSKVDLNIEITVSLI
jgi:hypothetical protein